MAHYSPELVLQFEALVIDLRNTMARHLHEGSAKE